MYTDTQPNTQNYRHTHTQTNNYTNTHTQTNPPTPTHKHTSTHSKQSFHALAAVTDGVLRQQMRASINHKTRQQD